MPKPIQISTTSGATWHTLTILLDDGRIFQRHEVNDGANLNPKWYEVQCPLSWDERSRASY